MASMFVSRFSLPLVDLANWIGKGKKFNARKETAAGEEYYGIKIFRFYIVSFAKQRETSC